MRFKILLASAATSVVGSICRVASPYVAAGSSITTAMGSAATEIETSATATDLPTSASMSSTTTIELSASTSTFTLESLSTVIVSSSTTTTDSSATSMTDSSATTDSSTTTADTRVADSFTSTTDSPTTTDESPISTTESSTTTEESSTFTTQSSTAPKEASAYTADSSTSASAPSSTSAPTSTPGCDNQGLDYAYFNHEFPDFESFDPAYFKTQLPLDQGVASSIDSFSGDCADLDGAMRFRGLVQRCTYFVVEYRAFFAADEPGDLTFTVAETDGAAFVWAGNTACFGWDGQNPYFEATPSANPQSITVPVTPALPLPVRLMWAKTGSQTYNLNIQVTFNDVPVADQQWIRYSCDRTTTPPFMAFGSER